MTAWPPALAWTWTPRPGTVSAPLQAQDFILAAADGHAAYVTGLVHVALLLRRHP